jgi:hypothetical protein
MTEYCGIYGYEITRVVIGPGFRIEPRTTNYLQARDFARDGRSYHLTAVISGSAVNADFRFDLEAVLSFIEHLDVLITEPRAIEAEDLFDGFEPTITTHARNNGGGAALPSDTFFPDSRAKFIVACLEKLSDESDSTMEKFRSMFFGKVETFRQRRPILEVSYFFLYSGLEARARLNDRTSRDSSQPICTLLQQFGFDVAIQRPSDLPRAISTYTHLRNSLFHNGELENVVKINNVDVEIKVTEYFYHLLQMVTLVVLKAVDFDDGHINWNSWIDRQPFK